MELAQETAKRLGLTYVAQPIAWDAKNMELESGNIDCIWNGFTMTGREDEYTWSEPYMENSQVVVVMDGTLELRLWKIRGRKDCGGSGRFFRRGGFKGNA